MNDDQREQVLANAKYLREVRPIDPEEITEYVEGQPHPAAIRQVLREEATDLGFRERDDGTFAPVREGPLEGTVDNVTRLPERYCLALEDALVEAYGPGWPDGETGDRLRGRIRQIKDEYYRGEVPTYDADTALGYAIYHLPSTYASASWVLGGLIEDGVVPTRCRVLDVGAGVGGQALALADHFDGRGLVEYHAVEPSPAAGVFETLVGETGRNTHVECHRETAEAFEPTGTYDLVLFSNVLSELSRPADVVGRYVDALEADGTVVAIEPADRNTAIGLREVERAVERDHGVTVYGPTVRLWPNRTPDSTSWSFDVKPDLDVPAFQQRLDEGARETRESDAHPGDGEFVNADVQFAYSLLRRDGDRRITYRPDERRVAPMATAETHVTQRIDCVGVKLSHDLSRESANPLFLVGDGSQAIDHFAVLTEESVLNEDLRTAGYGDVLRFENVLVLWNDDEDAYNLVVSGETVVDRMPV